ncbi:methyltransferase family protein [Anaerolentibacter hominis]|uniref:methyltransferase family protein n=1 Tax=Anaerolentibacter hominis TaxID=3079009 RepID=UPI0031B88B06
MNAVLLILPLFLIRFGLLGIINKEALKRAAFFAPVEGREKIAFYAYEISNAVLILYPLALQIHMQTLLYDAGLFVYAAGVGVLIVSTVCFAKPGQSGINTNGIYRISRNPMYLGYFLYFAGCVMLTRSLLLLFSLLVFQLSAHWIILSEERWCIRRFGREYEQYMLEVRRYI